MIEKIADYIDNLSSGERKELEMLFLRSVAGLPAIPGHPFFEVMSWKGIFGPPQTWQTLLSCWAINPKLHSTNFGLGVAYRRMVGAITKRERNRASKSLLLVLNADAAILNELARSLGRRFAKERQHYNFGQLATLVLEPLNSDIRMRIAQDFMS